MKNCREIKKLFSEYIESNMRIEQKDFGCYVVTPFLDYLNDEIRIYIFDRGEGYLEISDLGDTLEHLRDRGVNYTEGLRYDQILMTANRLGLIIENDYIKKISTWQDISRDICYFIAGMQEIGSLHLVARPRMLFDFKKQVNDFFIENHIRPIRRKYVEGKNSRKYKMDFIFKNGKLICQTLHAEHEITASNIITRYIAEFVDIKEANESINSMVIYNEKSPVKNAKFFDFMKEKTDYVYPFKKKKEILEVITSESRRF